VHAGFDLGVANLDLRTFANHPDVHNVIWPHRRDYGRLYLTFRRPSATVQIFVKGGVILTGCASEAIARQIAEAVVTLVQKVFGTNARLNNFCINNVAANGDLGFKVRFRSVQEHCPKVRFDSERFPGLQLVVNKVSVSVFQNGKITLTGAKNESEARNVFVVLWDMMAPHAVDDAADASKRPMVADDDIDWIDSLF
jgi:TATA-box binding protein (TBP) (component of TFIID and TFIIIB)